MKRLFFFIAVLSVSCNGLEYIDGQAVTLYKVLTGSHVIKADIDFYRHGLQEENKTPQQKRVYGVHNMQVIVNGCEPIDLVKDDVCFYPKLFTMLACGLSGDNSIVQRWACVKYIHSLSFAFKVESGFLKISSALYRWKILAPFLTHEVIPLKRSEDSFLDNNLSKNLTINLVVNGKNIKLNNEIVVL